ncbi:lymphocyte antigen 6 complex locus protein G6f isoform X1 [Anolis carolinensis]|uniref:Ig-like domain-containing protein n=1 Tax=Anolis carolinensis TaxID=28377 RepID=A0A803TBY5_ANOCA|nr:PREDICTED: lymphocyte antigen 6 complex locus protein G6f isoform X1 [Anolis carolinensis]|eukprot:XP_008119920.1 PREDICTED: lymphocyte antigen 6 complex locus protein G6f isoform X1 [Anolis carolinensis]
MAKGCLLDYFVPSGEKPKEFPVKMSKSVSQSSPGVAVSVLVAIVLCCKVCVGETIYAEKGSSPELPCPCPSCSGDLTRAVSWYFDHQGHTTPLFQKLESSHVIKRLPSSWDRLEVLQNYALRFRNLTDNDTGRYWCELGNYYDLLVVTGRKLILESNETNTTCYVLSCSISGKKLLRDVGTWWEGGEQIQQEDKEERHSVFRGQRATQLHICLEKETKERKVKCQFPLKTEIIFTLTVNEEALASRLLPISQAKDCLLTQCLESRENGGPWIPLAVCVALQFFIIFALGMILWRRICREKHEKHLKGLQKDVSKPVYKAQVYENVKNRSEKL